ncbi:MAG: acyl-ACP--UDP-N-acetylglucosamine O-acyltransferase [bacterium]
MSDIHTSAIIDKKAELASDITVGPFTIIDGDVTIGSGSRIDSHVYISNGARIGQNCHIHHGSVIATVPQDIKFENEKTLLEIGDNTEIREYTTLNRGTSHSGKSKVGKNCFLMAYTHVAHDCFIGDNCIIANGVQLAGHVVIEDWVIIGGLTPIHQFCRIGQHAFIGGGLRVTKDVPPYILAADSPLSYKGVNIVGLRRRGFKKDTIRFLQRCYRYLYRSNFNTSQAVEKIKSNFDDIPEIKKILAFIEKSERGIIK